MYIRNIGVFNRFLCSLKSLPLSKLPLNIRERVIKIVPTVLRPTFSLLPFSLQKKVILSALHSVFTESIAEGDFEFLQDKWLKISIIDLNLQWLISFNNSVLLMKDANNNCNYDVSFSANGDDLLLIAGRKQDPDTLFFQRKLKIEGDTELGLEVKNLIDAIELEQLPNALHKIVEYCAYLVQQTRDDINAQQLKHA